MELLEKYKSLFDEAEVNTPLRKQHFITQIDAESKLVSKRESLYYKTIAGLRNAFKTPFKGKTDAFVSQYLKNTEKCANYVYANREGNGNEKSGDGHKYRGGGFLQNTFKNGYKKLTEDTGIDFLGNPNLIIIEENAIIAALNYWTENNLNELADQDNLDSISDIINIGHKTRAVGDANGYIHRKECLKKWKAIIK